MFFANFTFRGSHLALPENSIIWIFIKKILDQSQHAVNKILTEYIIGFSGFANFFDFWEISIGQNVSNFPCVFITFIWFYLFVFLALFLFVNICQEPTTLATDNNELCIRLSQKLNKKKTFEMEIRNYATA